MQSIDLLIEPEWLLAVEPDDAVLAGHAVAVDGGAIVAVLPAAQARSRYAAREDIRLPGHALLPGLVNSHVHNPMTLMRGLADDLPLMVWLKEHIWPAEGRVLGQIRRRRQLAIAKCCWAAPPAAAEHYFFPMPSPTPTAGTVSAPWSACR